MGNFAFSLRPAELEDASAIAAILRETGWFPHLSEQGSEISESPLYKHLREGCAKDDNSVIVAEDPKGEIQGYISVHWLPYLILQGPEGYVSELFVRESKRGLGIGHALLEAVKQQSIRRGCSRLMLINGRNRLSYERGFYTKLGWQERPHMANFVLPLIVEG